MFVCHETLIWYISLLVVDVGFTASSASYDQSENFARVTVERSKSIATNLELMLIGRAGT